jgi:methionine-rich copper-binding protein CopC
VNTKRTLIVLIAVIGLAIPLYAHMKIEKTARAADSTVNAPPKQIQVWFNETPDAKVTKMSLTGSSGAVKLGAPSVDGKSIAAAIVGALPDGAYNASWQSAGDDGHAQRGEFKFTVKTK